jgi:hypothetical protein
MNNQGAKMTIDITDMLGRSRLSLDGPVRAALEQGRTVRSRNRDGEYAIVLSDDPTFRKPFEHVPGIADAGADWTIVVTDFTLKNVEGAANDGEPDLYFWAPVIDRVGTRVGTICVNASPYGKTTTDQGTVVTRTVFFPTLRAGDLFRESFGPLGAAVLFRATTDADSLGRVEAETVGTGERQVFDLGPDYLVSKVEG